jgi:hypothetical protein
MEIRTEEDLRNIAVELSKYNAQFELTTKISSFYLLKLDNWLWRKYNPSHPYVGDSVPNDKIEVTIGNTTFKIMGDGNYSAPEIMTDENGNHYLI